jgi:hypothetical protein
MKGLAGKFILTLIMFGMFSFLYIALNEAYDPLHTFATSQISDSDSLNTVTILNTMWLWLPIAVMFSYLVWNIETARKEREVVF